MKKQAAVFRAQRDEEHADRLLRMQWWNNAWHFASDENVTEAKRVLLDAAEAWRIAGNAAEEQRVMTREKNVKTEAEFLTSLQWEEEEKLIHDPMDYQRGQWTTDIGQAFVFAKFFERNLGDRKAELDALADQLGAQRHYTLVDKQKQGGLWLVCVFLYERPTQPIEASSKRSVSKKGNRTYVVQTGDTLFSISRRFYKSSGRWKEILDANKKDIRDPKKLTVGQTLIIP